MTEKKSSYTRPYIHEGKCTDEYTGKILPKSDCLTKSGKKSASERGVKTHEEIIDGKRFDCRNVKGTKYTRKFQNVTRKAYDRKGYIRKGKCSVHFGRLEQIKCNDDKKISPVHINQTKIKLTEKEISRSPHENCSEK